MPAAIMPAKAGIQHSVLHIAADTFARLDSGLRRNDKKSGGKKPIKRTVLHMGFVCDLFLFINEKESKHTE